MIALRVEYPRCRAVNDFVEYASRPTTQPVELEVGEAGLEFGTWGEFDYGGDTENETIACRSCVYEWPNIGVLEVHMRAAQALELLMMAQQAIAEDDDAAWVADLRQAVALLEPIDHREVV